MFSIAECDKKLCSAVGLLRFCYFRFRFGFGQFLAKNCGISFHGFCFSKHSAVVHGSDSPLADGRLQSSIQMPGHKTRTRQPHGRLHCPDIKNVHLAPKNRGFGFRRFWDKNRVLGLKNRNSPIVQ